MSVHDLNPKQARRLLDVLNYARKVVQYSKGIELAPFLTDEMRQLTLERCFEVIGEASRHLTPETVAQIGGLPLEKMRGLRNLISHDYHSVEAPVILRIAQQNVPLLVEQIEPYEKQLYVAANLEFPTS